MKTYKPHPPPLPEWSDSVKRMYVAGCARIDESRKQIGDDGVCPIPFRCHGCDEMRDGFALMTGDGCPICDVCVNRCIAVLNAGVGK